MSSDIPSCHRASLPVFYLWMLITKLEAKLNMFDPTKKPNAHSTTVLLKGHEMRSLVETLSLL